MHSPKKKGGVVEIHSECHSVSNAVALVQDKTGSAVVIAVTVTGYLPDVLTMPTRPPRLLTLQHTAAHCSTLQYTAAHCDALQHTATNI